MVFLFCHFRFVKANLTAFLYNFILSLDQQKCTVRHNNQWYWKENMYVNKCPYFRGQKCDWERIVEDFKLSRPYNWNTTHVECRTKVIQRATLISSKSFRKYLSNVLGKHEVKEIQQAAILGLSAYCGEY